KTTARPVCRSNPGDAADCLTTAPPGARLPCSTAVPEPAGCIGSASGRITSRFQHSAVATFTPMDSPVTVSASPSSRPASARSRSTTGSPPCVAEALQEEPARRHEIDDGGHLPGQLVEVVQAQLDAEPPGDRHQMDDRVRGPADGRVGPDTVPERRPRHDGAGPQ